jgi:segregation and condensation protein A
MEYLIKSEQFNGPIHILLNLIEDRKMHVSEVSLAAVTEDFLRFMNESHLPYAQVTSFIVIASTLVLIKARSLLPSMPLTDEEVESITDLTERVRQYAVVQKFAEKIAPNYLKNVSFERKWVDRNPVFAPDPQMTVDNLKSILEQVFVAFPITEKLPEKMMKTVVKIEEVIETLTKRIQEGITFHSRDIMDKYRNAKDPVEQRQAKVFAVVSFLAILELIKKGIANALQNENFSDIELNKIV